MTNPHGDMPESELEEFVLWVNGGAVFLLARSDNDSDWMTYPEYNNPLGEGTIVKAYASPDWQQMRMYPDWQDAVIIGYQERRLTAQEEREVRRYVAEYWYIPF